MTASHFKVWTVLLAAVLAASLLAVLAFTPEASAQRAAPGQDPERRGEPPDPLTRQEASNENKDNYSGPDGDSEEAIGTASVSESELDEDSEGHPYVAGELLIAYKEDASPSTKDEVVQKVGAKIRDTFPNIDSSHLSFPEIKNKRSEEAREQVLERKKQDLQQDPNVEAVSLNYIRRAAALPTDEYFDSQWSLPRIKAPEAWDTATGNGVAISVLDTGIDSSHPDVGGKVDYEVDFVNNDADADDDHGHGTHVAGIAAAYTDNGTGVAGTAPDARLYTVKVLDSNKEGTDDDIAAAIDWSLLEPAADVINMSLGGCAPGPILEKAINRAWNQGTVVVAAAGNKAEKRCEDSRGNPYGPVNPVEYPAAYANTIAVGAVNYQNGKSNFSSFHDYVDVAAPGGSTADPYVEQENIRSTYPRSFLGLGGYKFMEGTSQAAPHVSGLAAMLASQGLTASEIRYNIEATTVDLGADGKDAKFGFGLINAEAALKKMYRGVAATPYVNSNDPGTCDDPGSKLDFGPLIQLPDANGCIVNAFDNGNWPPLLYGLNGPVHNPVTGLTIGKAKDLDPDLSSGANSVTHEEFCRAFPVPSGWPYAPSGQTAQQYYEQTANAKERAILDPDGDGLACATSKLGAIPEKIGFGRVAVGTREVRNVVITNTGSEGSQHIEVGSVSAEGNSEFSTPFEGNIALEPGQERTFTVLFDPKRTGVKQGALLIQHDGENDALEIPLVGRGVPNIRGCTIVGTPDQEVIRGTQGRDVICAGRGDHTIRGLKGNDTIYGGPGRDRLYGQGGNDFLNVRDEKPRDLANGGAGSDRCVADRGDKRVRCER